MSTSPENEVRCEREVPHESEVPLEGACQRNKWILEVDARLRSKLSQMEQEYTEKLEAAVKTYKATIKALRLDIDDVKQKHKKDIAELEASIRPREVDVKLREDAVKVKEQEFKAQSRRTTNEGKEAGKELKVAKAQWEKQLKAAEDKVAGLGGELKSANEKYDVLKLDYDAVVSELETLKTEVAGQKPNDKVKEAFRKIKEERDQFKGLYEAARTDEPIIKDRIMNAVRLMEAKKDAEIDGTRYALGEKIQKLDEKILAAEARAAMAEKRVIDVLDVAGVTNVLIARNEKMIALYEEKLKLQNEKGRFMKELLDKMNELSEKGVELERTRDENARLKEALASVLE